MDKAEQRKQYWFVIRELTSREIKRKYSRSKLGIVWSVLNPLLTMAVMSMIFSYMFKHSIENYPIYYLCGNVIWQLFTGATNSAMTTLVDNKMSHADLCSGEGIYSGHQLSVFHDRICPDDLCIPGNTESGIAFSSSHCIFARDICTGNLVYSGNCLCIFR